MEHYDKLFVSVNSMKATKYACRNPDCTNLNRVVIQEPTTEKKRGSCEFCVNNDFVLLSTKECDKFPLNSTYTFDLKQL